MINWVGFSIGISGIIFMVWIILWARKECAIMNSKKKK